MQKHCSQCFVILNLGLFLECLGQFSSANILLTKLLNAIRLLTKFCNTSFRSLECFGQFSNAKRFITKLLKAKILLTKFCNM